MMLPAAVSESSEPKSNPVAVAESPETQTLTPAATKEASDILINCKISVCGCTQKLKTFICPATY
jgi:hypothetical protein